MTVGWKIASSLTPDQIELTIGGTIVNYWSVTSEDWTSAILPTRAHFSTFSPGTKSGDPDGAVDQKHTIGCQFEPERCRGSESNETWFWKTPGSVDVTLTLKRMEDGGGFTDLGSCKRTFTVERNNTDPERQPHVFYTSQRKLHGAGATDAADLHAKWHADRDSETLYPVFPGEDWIFFHRALVESYDNWRAFFGYSAVTPWDGSTALPTSDGGYLMEHPTRPGTEGTVMTCPGYAQGCAPPPWFTRSGDGVSARPDDLEPGRVCKTHSGQTVLPGQMQLSEFVDDEALGCVLNSTHHRLLHATIPGAFRLADQTPRDPVFWAYHKFISGPEVPFVGPLVPRAIPPEGSLFAAFEAELAEGPPGVSGVFPPRNVVLAQLPTVFVEFWEPVTGVAAGDLTVNGSPATDVQAHDSSSYIFWGFPDPGPVSTPASITVALGSGAIQDANANPFPGATWSYTVGVDQDGDSIPDVRDNCPTTPNTDQKNSSRSLVHGIYHGGTHSDGDYPIGRVGHPEGDACSPDDDGDGIDDATEAANGWNPTDYYDPYICPLDDPPKAQPGPCGCGWVDTLDGNGNCVLAIRCGALNCDDGDACSVDSCTPAQGCVRTDGEGMARVTCLCDRAPSPACVGQTLPAGITKKLDAACRLITKAVDASSAKKRKRFAKAASKKFAAASRVAKKTGRKGKLSTECVAGERSLFEDARNRTRLLLDPG